MKPDSLPYLIIMAIYAVASIYMLVATLRKDLQMFQHSSYRFDRYFRWLKGGNVLSNNRIWFAIMILLALNPWGCLVSAAIMVVLATKEFKTSYKTPLVVTKRVQRLFATTILVVAAFGVLSYLYWIGVREVNCLLVQNGSDCSEACSKFCCWILADYKVFAVAMAKVLLFSNFFMLLAAILNKPIEKSITSRYYNQARDIIRSHKGLIVIGITGSYGKTSTKNYLYRVLSEKYNVLITPGNYNTLLGVVKTIRESLKPTHQVFIVEMGAKQEGDIKEICDLVNPTIGIITSVGEAHLETFKSVENIQKTKFELVNSLPEGGFAILNYDSENILNFNGIRSGAKIVSYAINNKADYRAKDVEYNSAGLKFWRDRDGLEPINIKTKLLGEGNILNILAALAAADILEVNEQKQKNAVYQLSPVLHRLSVSRVGGLTILDDAYNSNPKGAKMALDVIKNFDIEPQNKRVVITPGFVEMGDRQYSANFELGENAAKSCDKLVVVNLLNREAIVEGAKKGGFLEQNIITVDSLLEAKAYLGANLKVGDVILYENDLPDSFK